MAAPQDDYDETIMLSVRVPRSLRERVAAISKSTAMSMQELARRGIESEVEIQESLLTERLGYTERLQRSETTTRRRATARRLNELHTYR